MSTLDTTSDALPVSDSPPALVGWLAVVLLTAATTTPSTYQSLRRYEELRSGWSWDLVSDIEGQLTYRRIGRHRTTEIPR